MGNVKITVFFVTKNGEFAPPFITQACLDFLKGPTTELGDIGMGNAYNMPMYLAGEIEEHIEEAVVICLGTEEEKFRPMVFMGENEVNMLLEALAKAGDDDDSWEICREVHKAIRT